MATQSTASTEILSLAQITRDERIQQRHGGMSSARVREYAKAMKDGSLFPPVIVYYDGQDYWLADGFHRCEARDHTEFRSIEAVVYDGTRRDALLHATGANAEHGIRRTNGDKRQAVMTLLQDEEWQDWSDHEIARQTHTSQPFVSKLRRLISNGTLRVGGDGRVIDTAKIGKRKTATLKGLWDKASPKERLAWVNENRDEIEALLKTR